MAEAKKPDVSREALGINDGAKEHRAQKVTTGSVTVKKKSRSEKAVSTFLGGEPKEVASWIVQDRVIPGIKRMAMDGITMALDITRQGLERLIFGESVSNGQRVVGQRVNYTSYNRQYVGGGRSNIVISNQSRAKQDFNQQIFERREDAESVLSGMYNVLNEYRVVRVSDFYDLCGVTSEFTDNNWGWYDLRGSSIMRVNNGYIVSLPPTVEIR